MRRRELISPPASAAAHPARANRRRAREPKPAMVASVIPVVASFAAVVLTTLGLVTVHSYLAAEHLVLVYLLPTILIAIYFGSIVAVLTSFASGLAAAYFLLPPQFSFYIADPRHAAELGFTVLLAAIASKVVAALAHDARRDTGAQPPHAR
jgi:two-component system, OmpR family, sensor histidine kinase KdpD